RTALIAACENRAEAPGARAEHLIAYIVIESLGAKKEAVFVPFEIRFGDYLDGSGDKITTIHVDVAVIGVHVIVHPARTKAAAIIDGDELAILLRNTNACASRDRCRNIGTDPAHLVLGRMACHRPTKHCGEHGCRKK